MFRCEQEIDSPKILLRRWLALVHLGKKAQAARTLLKLGILSLNNDMQRSLDAHKQEFAAEEERQESRKRGVLMPVIGLLLSSNAGPG